MPTEAEAYAAMMALKPQYPEGMHWTNDNFYAWNGGIYGGGYGCAGFAFLLSDAAFGDLPSRVIPNVTISDVHVGDILRVNNDTHSVICIERNTSYITLAEGNYNSSIHWGRRMTAAEIASTTDYLMTRYPVGTFGAIYNVTYMADGISSQVKEHGQPLLITDQIPSRIGYQFRGWATRPDSTQVAYRAGDSYTANADLTLYPVWEQRYLPFNPSLQTQTIRISEGVENYTFIPARSGYYTFESLAADSRIDPVIRIQDVSTGNNDGEDDNAGDYNYNYTILLTAGREYAIEFGYWGVLTQPYDVKITFAPFDTIAADAIPYRFAVSVNSSAGKLYSFTPEETATYTFESFGSRDTRIDIEHDGYSAGSDDDSGDGFNFRLSAELNAGTEYMITFNLYNFSNGETANFDVQVTREDSEPEGGEQPEVPRSDTLLAPDAFPYRFTAAVDSTNGNGYLFTPEVTGTYTFESFGEIDTLIGLYAGEDYVGSSDDDGTNRNFRLTAELNAGTQYRIVLRTYSGDPANFEVQITREEEQPPTCEHDWYTSMPALAPTCTTSGHTEEVKCRKCGEIQLYSTYLPMTGHTSATKPGTSATLFTEGKTEEVYCSICGEILSEAEVIPALKNGCGRLPVNMAALPGTGSVTASGDRVRAYWFVTNEDGTYEFTSPDAANVRFQLADGSSYLKEQVCSGGQLSVSAELKAGVTYYVAVSLAANGSRNVALTVSMKETSGPDTPEPPAPVNPFKDVSASAWYYDYVLEANRLGIMTGTKPDTFNPAGKVTRGVFATVLYRLEGASVSYKKYFPDVPGGVFYSEPITWAKENGVITGYNDGTFGPAKNVTREQIALILYRYTTEFHKIASPTNADLSKFVDGGRVSSFARDGMKWAVANGIISGTADGRLNPQGTASRAEIATMIVRYLTKF